MTQARKDLHAAELLAREEPSRSTFHSQQAVEKCTKAFLTFYNVAFRKTHDLEELGEKCVALNLSLGAIMSESKNLTDYAVVFRYVDAPREPDPAEAASALEIARRAHDKISILLQL